MTGQAEPTGRALTVLNEMVRAGVERGVALSEVTRMRLPGAPALAVTEAQQAEIDALAPAPRAIYNAWREAGHSAAAALQEVRASGAGVEISEAEFHDALGIVAPPVAESRPPGAAFTDAEFDRALGIV